MILRQNSLKIFYETMAGKSCRNFVCLHMHTGKQFLCSVLICTSEGQYWISVSECSPLVFLDRVFLNRKLIDSATLSGQ